MSQHTFSYFGLLQFQSLFMYAGHPHRSPKWIFDSFEMRDSAKHLSDLPVCSALFFLLFSPINTLNTINFGILAGWALNTASLTPKERVRQMWSQAGQRNSEEEEEAEQQSDAWHNKNGQEVRPGQPVVIQCTIQ